MKVLFIGKRFYTHRDALRERFGRIYQLPWHWAEAGIRTRLWLIDYHSRETVQINDGALAVESIPAISLNTMRRFCTEAFSRRGRDDTPNVVVASGDCYLGLLGYWIARRLRARFVFDVYDKYDEFSTYRRLPGFDQFTFLLQHSDMRMFASRALMERVGFRPGSDLVVPNGVDMDRFHPLDMLDSRRALGLPEDTIFVGYFGSMEPDRGVDDLIAAAQILRNGGIPVELLIGGRSRPDLDLQKPGIRYVGNVPFAKVPAMLACCDLLALPYRSSQFLDMASSCKIAEYIAMRRPIVATRTPNLVANFPEQAEMLDGMLAAPDEPAKLADMIRAQLVRKMIVGAPDGMAWADIAARTAQGLLLQ